MHYVLRKRKRVDETDSLRIRVDMSVRIDGASWLDETDGNENIIQPRISEKISDMIFNMGLYDLPAEGPTLGGRICRTLKHPRSPFFLFVENFQMKIEEAEKFGRHKKFPISSSQVYTILPELARQWFLLPPYVKRSYHLIYPTIVRLYESARKINAAKEEELNISSPMLEKALSDPCPSWFQYHNDELIQDDENKMRDLYYRWREYFGVARTGEHYFSTFKKKCKNMHALKSGSLNPYSDLTTRERFGNGCEKPLSVKRPNTSCNMEPTAKAKKVKPTVSKGMKEPRIKCLRKRSASQRE